MTDRAAASDPSRNARATRPAGRGRTLAALIAILFLAACAESESFLYYDRDAKLGRQDYRDQLAPGRPPPRHPDEPPIPELVPVIAPPSSEPPSPTLLVSLSTDGTVPLRELFGQIASQAKVDLELDRRIDTEYDALIDRRLVLSMRQRPLGEVIGRIAEMTGLRIHFVDGVLRVQLDEPFHRTYRVDFPNVERNTATDVGASVDVGSLSGSGGGSNASTTRVDSKSTAKFWADIEESLKQILENSGPIVPLMPERGTAAPAPAATPPQAASPGAAPPAAGAGTGPVTTGLAAITSLVTPTSPAPPGGSSTRGSPAGSGAGASSEAVPLFSINRQAGTVSVFATENQHRAVKDFLDQTVASSKSQVLIEARVLEVILNEEFQSGINWQSLFGGSLEFAAPFATTVGILSDGVTTPFSATYSGTDLTALVRLIQQFGTVRTLSSPRLTALHNQSAILKVVENRVYFTMEVDYEIDPTTGRRTGQTISSKQNTVPIGLVLSVLPTIDRETDSVSMLLRPTLTRQVGEVEDPAVTLLANEVGESVRSVVPVVAVQELESLVTLQSGQVIVMGGLMQDQSINTDTGLPVLGSVPLVGNLFKSRQDRTTKTELVVFLRATIVRSAADTMAPIDRDLYRSLGGDRRPLPF